LSNIISTEISRASYTETCRTGVFGITLSEEYDGAGANYTSYGLAKQELERGDSAVRSFASVQNSLVIYPISRYGTEEQKRKWLPVLSEAKQSDALD
jgi:glutaryl-CoA dehydrogenase